MRRFPIVRLLIVLAIVVVAFGFWRGWFAITTDKNPEGNAVDVRLKIDKDKIKQDEDRAKGMATDAKDKLTEPKGP